MQVTIARSHSGSEGAFMKSWAGWDELLQGEETEFRFLWAVEDMEDKPVDWVTVLRKPTASLERNRGLSRISEEVYIRYEKKRK